MVEEEGVLVDILSSCALICRSFWCDVVNVIPRWFIPIGWMLDVKFAAFLALTQSGFWLGLMLSVSSFIIYLALSALKFPAYLVKQCRRFCSILYCLDGIFQVLSCCGVVNYPMSYTGWLALTFQIPGCLYAWREIFSLPFIIVADRIYFHYLVFGFGVGLMFCGKTLLESDNPIGSHVAHTVAKVFLLGAFCNSYVLELMKQGSRMMLRWLANLLTMCHIWFWSLLGFVALQISKLLSHPWLMWLHHIFVAPVWRLVSPLFAPCATAYFVVRSILSIYESLALGLPITQTEYIFLFAHGFCALSSLLTATILFIHGIARIFRTHIDPLKFRWLKCLLHNYARCVSFLFSLIRTLLEHIVRIGWPMVKSIIRQTCRVISQCHFDPLVVLVLVVSINCAVLYFVYSSEFVMLIASTIYACQNIITVFFSTFVSGLVSIRSQPSFRSEDLTFALVAIAISQILVHAFVASRLNMVPPDTQRSEGQDATTLNVTRARVWGEVVVAVRAAAKAIIVPFLLLGLPILPTSLCVALALGYLIPWFTENTRVLWASNNEIYHNSSGPSSLPRRDNVVGACQKSEAMKQILAAFPNQVYLSSETVCSVCLDQFSAEALATTKNADALLVVTNLRRLMPPVVALRCGHPLHLDCVAQIVHAASGHPRHVRCPLCHEPVNLAGAISARIFG